MINSNSNSNSRDRECRRADGDYDQHSEINYLEVVATYYENVENMKNELAEYKTKLRAADEQLKWKLDELTEAKAKLDELGEAKAKLVQKTAELTEANAKLADKDKELADKDKELQAEKLCRKKEEGTYYLTDEEKRERDEKFVKSLNELKASYDNGYSALRELRETVVFNEYYEAIRKLAVVVNKQEFAHGKKQYVRDLSGVLRAFGAEPIYPEVGSVVNHDEADAYAVDKAQDNELVEDTDPNAVVGCVPARGWKLKGTSEGALLVRATVIVDK